MAPGAVTLPPGFVLEDEPQLPPGFVLDDDPPAEPTMMQRLGALPGRAMKARADLDIGMAKGVGSTVFNLGKLANKVFNIHDEGGAFAASGSGHDEIMRAITPENGIQKAGFFAEQLAEFFAPGLTSTKLPQGAGLAARMGTEGLSAAGVTAAQGGDPVAGGLAGAAGPVVSAGAKALAPAVANTMLGARKAIFRNGSNAGAGVVDEGVIAGTASGLVRKIGEAKNAVGQELSNLFANSPTAQGTLLDLTAAVHGPITKAQAALATAGNTPAMTRLNALAQGIEESFKNQQGAINAVTPAQANVVRDLLDKGINHGGTDAVEASVKNVVKAIRRNMSQAITAAVPESAALNKRYSNIAAAADAAWDKLASSHGLGAATKVVRAGVAGAIGYELGGSDGAKLGTVGAAASQLPAVGTLGAAGLALLGGKGGAALMPKLMGTMASSATRAMASDAHNQSGGNTNVALQLMGQQEAVYVTPNGDEVRIPPTILNATISGDPMAEESPVTRWLSGMTAQKKIEPGGQLLYRRRGGKQINPG